MPVDKAFNIKIETESIHPKYIIDSKNQELIGDTKLLKLFELKPLNHINGPLFRGRWDEKNQLMDIDIENANKTLQKSFKNSKNDCTGHHPELINEIERTFKVLIIIKGEKIYEGLVFFNINHAALLEGDVIKLTGYPVDLKLIKKERFEK